MSGFVRFLESLDRRWIYLAMAIAVAGPIIYIGLTGKTLPETATPAAQAVFDAIEELPSGGHVLFSFDFDPASGGELIPMATSIVRQCAARGHKMVFIALWPLGAQLVDETIKRVITADYPHMKEGVDYINFGYQAGNEAVMKVMLTDFAKAFPNSSNGTPTTQIPVVHGVTRASDFPLLVTISAGYPGAKEWIQYVVSSSGGRIKMVTGCTGVQTPQLYPYYPTQLTGMLGAIKGAAEYESIVNDAICKAHPGTTTPAKYLEAQRRMGPQLGAHLLMVVLIILGNIAFFAQKRAAAGAKS
ncbi:MAG: hypothetical protein EXS03_09530 [Phycisphaerales bacterium]|nr:hypothetical protein [Phycisphaerales bacterium]